jgi:hypothetical protein
MINLTNKKKETFIVLNKIPLERELAEWFKAISLKLILVILTSVRIGYSLRHTG